MANSPLKRLNRQGKVLSRKNPVNIARAKEANKLLGTKFKTRGGISKYAITLLNKIEAQNIFIRQGPVAPTQFVPVRVKNRKLLSEIKRQGSVTIGKSTFARNVPYEIKEVKKAIKENRAAGVKIYGEPGQPRTGIRTISLKLNGIKSMRQFIKAIDDGSLDNLKHPNEWFAFRYFGHNANVVRPFRNAAELRVYLEHYKFMDEMGSGKNLAEEFANFELVTVFEVPWIPSSDFTYSNRPRNRTQQDRRAKAKKLARKALLNATRKQAMSEAERKAKYHANETEAHRRYRLFQMREYSRAYRQRNK